MFRIKENDHVMIYKKTNGNELCYKDRIRGMVTRISTKRTTNNYLVKYRAPWGFTTGWYSEFQLKKLHEKREL